MSVSTTSSARIAALPPSRAGLGRLVRRLALGAAVAAAALALAYLGAGLLTGGGAAPVDLPAADPPLPGAWDGTVRVEPAAQAALGLTTAPVEPQTKPIRLELLGTTRYDEDTLTRIRMLFKGRIDRVHVRVGQEVQAGDPLFDIYSTELGEAKNNYEIARIQWQYDHNLLASLEGLRKSTAIAERTFLEAQNTEMKHRREMEIARDKLLIFGLTEQEIANSESEVGAAKARMTLRTPAAGIVIERNVVPGNLYDEEDTLLVIAPLDHLWVWGNVFESDLDLVHLGQKWEIQFPFLRDRLPGRVEYISNQVDPGTHAVRIRTSIPNPGGRLKSNMLVQGVLEIPPAPGRTVVPRSALIVADARCYVFVRREEDPHTFARRTVTVAHEKADYAVIDIGLSPGEEVVTTGALILGQMHEELRTRATGMQPANGHSIDEARAPYGAGGR